MSDQLGYCWMYVPATCDLWAQEVAAYVFRFHFGGEVIKSSPKLPLVDNVNNVIKNDWSEEWPQ